MSSDGRGREPLPAAEVAVRAADLCKVFAYYPNSRDRLVEWATLGQWVRHQEIHALRHVSLELAAGGSLALVGANGAGKSTLLKILSGTLFQTSGRVEVRGRVASLLELGMGFQHEFSGRDNLRFNARFLGLSEDEIRRRLPAMIAFAELGEAIERPLRTYSSGMLLRLAFAVVAHVDPDILIIDEALAVGDAYFTQKCLRRLERFRAAGVSLLFASHDPLAVKTLCDRALLLEEGRALALDTPERILEQYNARLAAGEGSRRLLAVEGRNREESDPTAAETPHRSGTFGALLAGVSMTAESGEERRSFIAGGEVTVRLQALFLEEVDNPTVGILIRDRLGNDVFGTNTFRQEIATGTCRPGDLLAVEFRMNLDLGPGEYTLTAALHARDSHLERSYDWIDRLLAFQVLTPPAGGFIGTAFLRPRIRVDLAASSPTEHDTALARALRAALRADAPRRLDMVPADERWRLQGWFPAEEGEDGPFAWTGRDFAFVVDLRGAALELEVAAGPAGGAAGNGAARLSIGSREVGPFPLPAEPGWQVVRVPIPAELAQATGWVRVQVPAARPPQVAGRQDDRLLGLRVRSIRVA